MGMLVLLFSRNMHLEDMQLGYSMDSNGRSLVGTNHGNGEKIGLL
ncbi:hypothetical protein [Niallia taxi]|nr:hypothetical protein [Niallia taxi]